MKQSAALLRASAMAGVAAIAVATAIGSAPAAAQDQPVAGVEEIIVTAQRRAERLQEVPIAVAAITAQALENTGIDTTRDLPQVVPSVQFTRSGASGLLFIRGVGTTNAAVGEESSNAVYVDGVYMADLAQVINNFNNIERVEVLKGPQGTLFGRNATGGLVHIITREPGDELTLNAEIGYGNYETVSGRAYVAAPITENISADIAVTKHHQNDGWGTYVNANDRKAHIQDYWGVRSKIVLRASDAVKFTLAGDYNKNKDNLGIAWKLDPGTLGTGGAPGPAGYGTTANHYSLTRQKIYGVSLTGEVDLGLATLTSISAYRKTRNISDFDVDAGPLDLVNIAFVSGGKSYQQEIRLASNDTEPLSWQVGAFYLHAEASNDSNFTGLALAAIRPPATPTLCPVNPAPCGTRSQKILADLTTNSYAVFGELSYAFTPTTHLTGGVRYTTDRRHFVGSQFSTLLNGVVTPSATVLTPSQTPLTVPGVQDSRLRYNKVTWRVALRQEITPDINAYASVNRGFKSGSYSLQNPLNEPYLPQFITAYEVGLKTELFDRKLRLNISAYHYDVDDYQVRSAAVASPGSSLILNAATVKVDGVDVEFEAAPTRQLRLFGGFTVLDSRFDKFGGPNTDFQAPIVYPQPATCPADQRGTRDPGVLSPGARTGGFATCFGDVSGLETPNSPDFTASFGASYTVPVGDTGQVRLSALYSYNSGFVFEADNVAKQDEYHLLNASIEYRPVENVGIEFWGRNLTKEVYAVQKITTGTGVAVALGAPRTYGVNLKFDF